MLVGFSCSGLFAFAAEKADSITIFIDGINSENIIDAVTGDVLYPPSGNAIAKAVIKNIPVITGALLTGKHEKAVPPLAEAVNALFAPAVVDENGLPPENAVFDYKWPTAEEIRAFVENKDPGKRLKYAFDWRLDMMTTARDLHSFIEYVMDAAGVHSVDLIGCSMGTCALMSYLKMYDFEYVRSVVILVGALNGVSSCGEPFAGKISLNSDSIVRYTDTVLGFDLGGVIASSLLHSLNASGIMDFVVKRANALADELKAAVYSTVFADTFAKIPGMWALVPFELYEQAKSLAGTGMSRKTLEASDWYHYEVQANNEDILRECLERGIKMGIIAKYGYPGIPCYDSCDAMSDSVIDTVYESFGAVCADAGKTLGSDYSQAVVNGHDCISPDGLIDSSTCTFCDQTWFIKNSKHADSFSQSAVICNYIINSDEQVTVWDNKALPQYLVISSDDIVPLTSDNAPAVYRSGIEKETVLSVFADFIKSLTKLVRTFFADRFACGM